MNIKKWLKFNTTSLAGKTVAVTGTTGGIGKQLCRYLAGLGANLILLDRNPLKSEKFRAELIKEYEVSVKCFKVDLEDIISVKNVVCKLRSETINVFIHNAGAYSIPRHMCDTGLDNVFQINFASPYYITKELLPQLRQVDGRVVAVGSIAHNYSKTDMNDIDFSTRKQASLVYGNAKRYLMFSLYELFKGEEKASLAVTHPGITFTNITAHYPKPIFALIKHPMKIIFMKPEKACLSILKGVFTKTDYHEWIGPSLFNVWGCPAICRLSTCSVEESRRIGASAEDILQKTEKVSEPVL